MEENIRKPEIRYSEPVREIMGSPPRKILLWGTSAILTIIVLFILFAWYLKYPDLITSPIEITTENPPVILVSKVSGQIKDILVNDKDTVYGGEILAVMETSVAFDQYMILKQFVDTVSNPEYLAVGKIPDLTELGSLQNSYGEFRKNLADYDNFLKNDLMGLKINSSVKELSKLKDYIDQLKENEKLYSSNLEYEKRFYNRQSTLISDKTITPVEFERSKQALLEKQIELGIKQSEIKSKEIDYTRLEEQIASTRIARSEEVDGYKTIIDRSFGILKAEIKTWENGYLLKTNIDGIVTYLGYWSNNQTVRAGDEVMAVVPLDPGKYIGRLQLKLQRSGKVDTGSLVNIKLLSNPYLQYGMLRGRVRAKSLVTSEDAYAVEVELPDGLKTLYGNELRFEYNMKGSAEIVTDDKSLLEKVIYPFRYLYTKNKR